MRQLRHPFNQHLYEWDQEGVGPVLVTTTEGLQGRYDGDGAHVDGEKFQVDPELCRWIASGGSRVRSSGSLPRRRRGRHGAGSQSTQVATTGLPEVFVERDPDAADPAPRASISVDRYTTRAFHELEKKYVWDKVWQFACRVDHVAEVGDTYVYDICGRSILIVRVEEGNHAGAIRAYHNVCLHRGRALVDNPCRVDVLRCSFHGFTWGLDGALIRTASEAEFSTIDPKTFSLPEVRVGTFDGFVFVSLDPDAEPFEVFIGDLGLHLKHWDFEHRFVEIHVGKVLECNWKIAQDAFLEALHVPSTHPQMAPHYDDVNSTYDLFGNFTRMWSPRGVPSPRLRTSLSEQDIYDSFVDRRLDDPTDAIGELTASQALARRLRQALRRGMGSASDRVADDELVDITLFSLFPNFHPWGAYNRIVYRFRPYGDDHTRCVQELMFLSPYVGQRPDPAPFRLLTQDEPWTEARELGSLGRVLMQDVLNHTAQQRGLNATTVQELPLASYQERIVGHFHNLFDSWIEKGQANADTAQSQSTPPTNHQGANA